MNIIMGLCGEGRRFKQAGYALPKFLIPYNGAPMIYHAMETLNIPGKRHIVVKEEHLLKFKFLEKMLLGLADELIVCRKTTQGAAESLLLSKKYISDHHLPFISLNCDQYMNWNPNNFLKQLTETPEASYIITYKETSPKCSYVKKDATGRVLEVREKKVISDDATIGVYHWAHTSDFFIDAEKMIADKVTENDEYYVGPVYNYSIARKLVVKNYEISADEFWPVGTPDDLHFFLKNNYNYL
jgi:dTDP-glucose pyrophosphorylase